MKKSILGNTGMGLTPLGVGAWAMGGGGWAYSAGPQDDNDSIRAIHRAMDRGINWIDTAPLYGLGHSEEVVGRALQGRYPRPYIFTKCGAVWNSAGRVRWSLKARSIRREVEASLGRLKVDAIDLYQIHQPQPSAEIEEGWETLAQLRQEGLIRHAGVSNFGTEEMKRAAKIAPIAALQPPYSIVERDIQGSVLPFAAQHGIGVIVYSPMQSGLLSGNMTKARIADMPKDDFRANYPHFREPLLSRNLALAELLREIGRRRGRSVGEVAIAWTLRNEAVVTGAIVGVRSPQHVEGVLGAVDFRLDEEEILEIDTFLEQNAVETVMVERVSTVVGRLQGAVRRLVRGAA